MRETSPCARSSTAFALLLAVLWAAGLARAQQTPAQQAPPNMRMERDLLGSKAIPANAYYGVQTARALENFRISGVAINHYPEFIRAWAMVKLAAAQANADAGVLPQAKLVAIEKACRLVMAGRYKNQFLVDMYQGGAGTSTNMNFNEVLANIALEQMGHKKGEYQYMDSHDDLNMSQSTNDTYPTAVKVALILRDQALLAQMEQLSASFRKKGDAYLEILKMGRTEMQDAVPMTVGQELNAFASSLDGEIKQVRAAETQLYAINMGGTAIGTGLNAPKGYASRVAVHLSELTGKPIVVAPDLLDASWDQGAFEAYSAALNSLAVSLSKISGDLILLASGPRAGLEELNLPALQPGSSIMPGKVNPVAPEVMNLVAFRVMANNGAVTLAAHSGQLQLNAYEPLEAIVLMESQELLRNTVAMFRTRCVDGITVNEKTLNHYMETTIGIVTALNPILGYEKATQLAAQAAASGKGVLQLIREQRLLTEQQIKQLMDPVNLTGLNKAKYQQH